MAFLPVRNILSKIAAVKCEREAVRQLGNINVGISGDSS
jgi:hypothetical protein